MQCSEEFLPPGQYHSHIDADQAAWLIRWFRSWIGRERLERATAAFHAPETQFDSVKAARLEEHQPLIHAFGLFDKRSMGGRRRIKRPEAEIKDLAAMAATAFAVAPTLPPRLADHQRAKLVDLDGRLKPLLLEWTTAAHVIRTHGAHLAWANLGGEKQRPEFAGRTESIEFEVECKYQSTMVGQHFGERESDNLASWLIHRIRKLGMTGDVRLDVPMGAVKLKTQILNELDAYFQTGTCPGGHVAVLPSGVVLTGTLTTQSGRRPSASEMHHRLSCHRQLNVFELGMRSYLDQDRTGLLSIDPINVFVMGPLKTEEEFSEVQWEKRFKHAAEQCTGMRGAILVFEWVGIHDARIFARTGVYQDLMQETFRQYHHVARMVTPMVREMSGHGPIQSVQ